MPARYNLLPVFLSCNLNLANSSVFDSRRANNDKPLQTLQNSWFPAKHSVVSCFQRS